MILVYYCDIKQQYWRKHAGSMQEAPGSTYHPIKAEWGTHTNKTTFLGSTHGCFLRASFCFIINGSYCTVSHWLSVALVLSRPDHYTYQVSVYLPSISILIIILSILIFKYCYWYFLFQKRTEILILQYCFSNQYQYFSIYF